MTVPLSKYFVQKRDIPFFDMTLEDRLAAMRQSISNAAARSGRNADDVTLIAVSKTFPSSDIVAASRAGQVDFGENKVQELISKVDELGSGTVEHPIVWHHIGHLQRNKVKDIIGRALLFHALDSTRLAQALQARLEAEDTSLKCLIQVNVSGETSKFGIEPDDLGRFMDAISACDRVIPTGLMTLAAPVSDAEKARPELVLLRRLGESISDRLLDGVCQLSMGMSSDYEVAIEEGATHVRVGSAIFGTR
ncbi:MAG: YggS family pyridoxal phosphate-dependent enzyme [Bacteroidetes bacterium]|nr:YggS family pyridoxal phosphate-dependent enzyme [Bacteroidota bacterium]MDA1334071.1 YggS family pyridoxal phosphate-dependent enzyme [Bacteroidota bacterium]